ncbi:MAG: magnesium/cobalt transporter CorA [Candidatus Aenigmatarchaeota archaeon]
MSKFIKRVSKKTGMSPGSLVHIGTKITDKVKMTLIDYKEDKIEEKELKKVEDSFPFKNKPTITWINISGLHDTEIIKKIGDNFEIHPLVLEDILNTNHRPKLEDFDKYVFIVLQMLSYNEKKEEVNSEQVSLILGSNFVLSFQEREGDVFDYVRTRIRDGKGKIRKSGSDYLLYSLLDAIVDNYFVVLEKMGDQIESLEDDVLGSPTPNTLNSIHKIKRELIFTRKSIWPLREAISKAQKLESNLIETKTEIYLRDVYDHIIQIIDTTETYKDMVSGMIDVYLSSISNKMNEVMKVLTIIATIFIPLTFIAGIYGMNFQHMPELSWQWSYPIVWTIMIIIGLIMLGYFRRKDWI